jgi:hypothetical protein
MVLKPEVFDSGDEVGRWASDGDDAHLGEEGTMADGRLGGGRDDDGSVFLVEEEGSRSAKMGRLGLGWVHKVYRVYPSLNSIQILFENV